MTWTNPSTPVAGTAITVAFYNTNIRDNLNHLRNLTGGADPVGAGQIIVSVTTGTAQWSNTITGGLAITGGNLTMGSTRQLAFTAEQATKIDMDGGSYTIGTAANTVFTASPADFEWRNGATVRMKLTGGGSPSLAVGGNTVATLNSANFTTLQQGGSNVLTSANASNASGTYTGDGGTGGRQITCGFVPKGVQIIGGDTTADLDCAIITSTSGALRFIQASPVTYVTSVKLHASDGFTVGSGNDFCNQGARTYRWAAYR